MVDGVDGRTHHIKLPDLDAVGDGRPVRSSNCAKFDDAGAPRRAGAVRSDHRSERPDHGDGATRLDRRPLPRTGRARCQGGFGAEVREAMDRRG